MPRTKVRQRSSAPFCTLIRFKEHETGRWESLDSRTFRTRADWRRYVLAAASVNPAATKLWEIADFHTEAVTRVYRDTNEMYAIVLVRLRGGRTR